MLQDEELVDWVGRCIVPWESYVRAWLWRASVPRAEADDIVQEAYCRISDVPNYRSIGNPRAYFLGVARNILNDQLRRSKIVRIDTVAEMESLNLPDDRPSQEQATIAKEDLARLKRMIDGLPNRCRTIFVLRKIEGLSQREIALRLDVSENTVEAQVRIGMQRILSLWDQDISREPHNKMHSHGVGHERTKL